MLRERLNCAEGFFEWMHRSARPSPEKTLRLKSWRLVMNAERRAFFAGTLKYNVNRQDEAISGSFRPVRI